LNFLSEADSLLELERVNSLSSRGDGGRRLVSAFANVLSFTRVEDERFARPELHRGRTRQLRNNGTLMDVVHPRGQKLSWNGQRTSSQSSHCTAVLFFILEKAAGEFPQRVVLNVFRTLALRRNHRGGRLRTDQCFQVVGMLRKVFFGRATQRFRINAHSLSNLRNQLSVSLGRLKPGHLFRQLRVQRFKRRSLRKCFVALTSQSINSRFVLFRALFPLSSLSLPVGLLCRRGRRRRRFLITHLQPALFLPCGIKK